MKLKFYCPPAIEEQTIRLELMLATSDSASIESYEFEDLVTE